MPILNPITTERKIRDFAVIDLEWFPGEALPMPETAFIEFDAPVAPVSIPFPTPKKTTKPLQVRMASMFDQVTEPSNDSDEEVRTDRFECFMMGEGRSPVRELLDFILVPENRGRWFYAHAGGLSDMEFVLDEILNQVKEQLLVSHERYKILIASNTEKTKLRLDKHVEWDEGAWKIRASFSGSSAIIVHVSKGKHAWHFCDSYWLLRDSLASIGKAIGLHKGGDAQSKAFLMKRFGKDDLEALLPDETKAFYTEAPLPVLASYNKVDCEILYKAIKQFEDEIVSLGGQLQQTIASTGMTLFRRSYLKSTIYTSERLNQVADDSYFASRVEVVSRNCLDPFDIFDINSSFPFSMTFPLPAGVKSLRTTLPDEDSDSNLYLADVTIEVPDMPLPPVPYRVDGRVFFPTGKWRSWLTSTDVRLALREGCKLHKVHEVYTFEPFFDLKGYAEDIYAKRAVATSDFRKLVLKYLLNCLYGKFAEGVHKQEMIFNPEVIDRKIMQALQPGVWLSEKAATIAHRHVPVSTFITALSRRHLYDGAKICYEQGHSLLYCDTDSIATRAVLPSDETQLGAFKHEKKMEWAQFLAPKIYYGEGLELKKGQWVPVRLTKAKGFSLGKAKGEAWERFEAIAGGDRVGIQRMIRLRELYRTGLQSPVEIMVVKALTFEMLSKRFHYPDGETRAWNIKELVSGDVYPKGFDFEPEIADKIDTTTRAMLRAVV